VTPDVPSNPADSGARLRQRPEERFAAPAELFDFAHAAAELAAEAGQTHQGHRQKMLYRHGGASVSLFVFSAGAGLREHRTNGTVLIQALEGHLKVQADGREQDLLPGRLLAMSPKVPHDVTAVADSRMLLIVSLDASS
jgi:quercetin dioxygenase-like cupin family protein